MNIPEPELETILRRAPKMKAPARLKARIIADNHPAVTQRSARPEHRPAPVSWLRRWWPALAPTMGALACAAVLAAQQREIKDLKQSLATVVDNSSQVPGARLQNSNAADVAANGVSPAHLAEIERLRTLVSELAAQVAQLERLSAENAKLRTQLASLSAAAPSTGDADAEAREHEKALSIQCINNLKQFGLSIRVWALDQNPEINPPDVLCMSNELSAPIVLICPADTSRQAASSWSSFSGANLSYEYLAPGGSSAEPSRVLSRCPIHGHIGLCDGSVQSSVVKNHPDWLINRDGKLYMETPYNQLGR
jgi:hypothetical protein